MDNTNEMSVEHAEVGELGTLALGREHPQVIEGWYDRLRGRGGLLLKSERTGYDPVPYRSGWDEDDIHGWMHG